VLRRKALRLRTFDYGSEGLYFVTVCTRARRCTLGEVRADAVRLSRVGATVRAQLESLPERLGVAVDAFVVMPNHVHAIVGLDATARARTRARARARARQASPLRLGTVVGSFKS